MAEHANEANQRGPEVAATIAAETDPIMAAIASIAAREKGGLEVAASYEGLTWPGSLPLMRGGGLSESRLFVVWNPEVRDPL